MAIKNEHQIHDAHGRTRQNLLHRLQAPAPVQAAGCGASACGSEPQHHAAVADRHQSCQVPVALQHSCRFAPGAVNGAHQRLGLSGHHLQTAGAAGLTAGAAHPREAEVAAGADQARGESAAAHADVMSAGAAVVVGGYVADGVMREEESMSGSAAGAAVQQRL